MQGASNVQRAGTALAGYQHGHFGRDGVTCDVRRRVREKGILDPLPVSIRSLDREPCRRRRCEEGRDPRTQPIGIEWFRQVRDASARWRERPYVYLTRSVEEQNGRVSKPRQ